MKRAISTILLVVALAAVALAAAAWFKGRDEARTKREVALIRDLGACLTGSLATDRPRESSQGPCDPISKPPIKSWSSVPQELVESCGAGSLRDLRIRSCGSVVLLHSAGPDGIFQLESVGQAVVEPATDDILWTDGYFVAYPGKAH